MCVTRLHSNILHHHLSVGPKSPQQVFRSGDNSAFDRSNNNHDGLDTKRSDGVNWPSGNQALGWYISKQNGIRSESTYWPTTPVSVTVVCLDPVCTDLSALHSQTTETFKPGTTPLLCSSCSPIYRLGFQSPSVLFRKQLEIKQ